MKTKAPRPTAATIEHQKLCQAMPHLLSPQTDCIVTMAALRVNYYTGDQREIWGAFRGLNQLPHGDCYATIWSVVSIDMAMSTRATSELLCLDPMCVISDATTGQVFYNPRAEPFYSAFPPHIRAMLAMLPHWPQMLEIHESAEGVQFLL